MNRGAVALLTALALLTLAPELRAQAQSNALGLAGGGDANSNKPVNIEAENGIVAPAGTPADIIALLSRHVAAILADPEVAGPLVAAGFEIASGTPAELGARIAKDLAKYPDVVRKAHAQVD